MLRQVKADEITRHSIQGLKIIELSAKILLCPQKVTDEEMKELKEISGLLNIFQEVPELCNSHLEKEILKHW